MSEKESHDASVEAQRDMTTHPERPLPHVDTIGHYLAGIAYAVSHPRRATPEREDDTADSR